jgi:cytidylate kinase
MSHDSAPSGRNRRHDRATHSDRSLRGDGERSEPVGGELMVVVAIDGPAGSGKSTISRALAQRLDVPHVDTGAYYRALTLAVLRAGADPRSESECVDVMADTHICRKADRTLVNGEDVEDAIRSDAVDANVSAVARHRGVRRRMVEWQREAIGPAGAVVEGRDAASVIVPHATLKVWLTAAPAIRARRRALQQGTSSEQVIARLSSELAARDHADRHNTHRSDDAVEIDTSDASVDQIVDRIRAMLEP